MEEGKRPMMQLYWSPRSRSFSAIWLMEETGLPYERVLTDITTGAQKAPEFLAINPMGKVPALKDGDAALGEAAAICGYVADRYPQTKLAPDPADPKRAKYLQWLLFSPSCIEPALIQIFTKIEVPSSTAAWGSATQVFDALDAALAKGPWILGEAFSAGHHDRLGAEFRGAAIQDGAVAPVVRRLYRALRRAPGVPARREDRGGVTSCGGKVQAPYSPFNSSGRGIEMTL
jgi:glutathione S-transferase